MQQCPFLIRLFITKNKHTPMQDFDEGRFPEQDEFHAYGWYVTTTSTFYVSLWRQNLTCWLD